MGTYQAIVHLEVLFVDFVVPVKRSVSLVTVFVEELNDALLGLFHYIKVSNILGPDPFPSYF